MNGELRGRSCETRGCILLVTGGMLASALDIWVRNGYTICELLYEDGLMCTRYALTPKHTKLYTSFAYIS